MPLRPERFSEKTITVVREVSFEGNCGKIPNIEKYEQLDEKRPSGVTVKF